MSAGILARTPPLLVTMGREHPPSRRSRFRQEQHGWRSPKNDTFLVRLPPHAQVRSLVPRAGLLTRTESTPCPSSIDSSNACGSRSFSARTSHPPIDAAGSLPRLVSLSCSRTCSSAASLSTALENGPHDTLPRHSGSPTTNCHHSTTTASDDVSIACSEAISPRWSWRW